MPVSVAGRRLKMFPLLIAQCASELAITDLVTVGE
jgi:hypothetical protein